MYSGGWLHCASTAPDWQAAHEQHFAATRSAAREPYPATDDHGYPLAPPEAYPEDHRQYGQHYDDVSAETDEALACPRCGEVRPRVCLACGGGTFRVLRPGVVKLRDDLAALVPKARVVAVDAGSAPLPAFDVAVGTEAVLHRVPRDGGGAVRLVAFLEFDQELLAPRYRAAEQSLWLLVRGARMLGPRRDGGTLLVQTRLPSDPVVVAARDGDPSAAAADERRRRIALRFPPYAGLAEVGGNSPAVDAACDALRPSLKILGPDRDRALARASSAAELCDAFAAIDLTPARALGRLRVDVDPLRV